MKITVDIDCTPEEARQFLGLPDVRPMQEAMSAAMQERMAEMMQAAGSEDLIKAWMPGGFQGMEALQKMFFQAAGAGSNSDKKD